MKVMHNKNRNLKLNPGFLFAGIAVLSLVGCKGGAADPDLEAPGVSTVKDEKWTPNSPAGLPIEQDADATKFSKLVASNSSKWGPARKNPFALTPTEAAFDQAQGSERIFSTIGGFTTRLEPKSVVEDSLPVQEPQPYRRLSGIVVGDSVIAIIELNNGTGPLIIRPGMKIPGTPWTVVSIDQEKAVLRREGDVQPKEVIVRLETPPPGYGPAAAGGGAGFPGGGPGSGPSAAGAAGVGGRKGGGGGPASGAD